MEISNLATLLKQTLDPAARERAEAELQNVRKIIGFCPGLLQVVMNNSIDAAVRQAGVIYFKNLVSSSWVPKVKKKLTVSSYISTPMYFEYYESSAICLLFNFRSHQNPLQLLLPVAQYLPLIRN